jgi:hypothetical protein
MLSHELSSKIRVKLDGLPCDFEACTSTFENVVFVVGRIDIDRLFG